MPSQSNIVEWMTTKNPSVQNYCDSIGKTLPELAQSCLKKVLKDSLTTQLDPTSHVAEWKPHLESVETIVFYCDDFEPVLNDLMGVILRCIDDHEPMFKIRGLNLLSHALKGILPAELRSSGLGLVVFESVKRCWSYLEEPQLTNASLTIAMELAPVLHVKESMEYYQVLERIMNDGILTNLTFCLSGRAVIIETLLNQGCQLMPRLSIFAFKFLKPFLGVACELLEYYTPRTRIMCLQVISICCETCWPRIPEYKGLIVASLAGCWRASKKSVDQHELNESYKTFDGIDQNELSESLKTVFGLLKRVCGNELDDEISVLLEMDRELYLPLVQ